VTLAMATAARSPPGSPVQDGLAAARWLEAELPSALQEDDVEDEEEEELAELFTPYQQDVVRRQKDRVISIILGNLFTLGIVGLIYFNFVLFESYIGVFLYAFLASEALWDTKKAIVETLAYLNDTEHVSPRKLLEHGCSLLRESLKAHARRWIPAGVAVALLSFFSPEVSIPFFGIPLVMIAMLYLLDRRVFLLTKVHRVALTDDTFVALLLIVVLMVLGAVFSTLFAFFAANDIKMLLEMISSWVEQKLLSSAWAQEAWHEFTDHGEHTVDSWLSDFEKQYVTNTTWEPAFRWIIKYMEQSRQNGNETSQNCVINGNSDVCESNIVDAMPVGSYFDNSLDVRSPSSWGNFFGMPNYTLEELVQLAIEHTKTTDLNQIRGRLSGVIMQAREGFWTSTIFTFSLLLLVIDFGVRIMFFITILFILLSSEENLMHEILTGFFSSDHSSTQEHAPEPGDAGANGTSSFPNASPNSLRENRVVKMLSALSSGDDETHSEPTSEPWSEVGSVASPAVAPPRVSEILRLEHQLRATMEAVLMLTVRLSFYRALATFGLYKLMGVQLPYLGALLTIALTLFPILYAYWVCLPWCLVLAFNGHSAIPIALFTLNYMLNYQIDSWVLATFQRKVQKDGATPSDQSKNEFLTGMSMFFGVTAFGGHGVITGPLLVCLGIVSYNTLKDTQRALSTKHPQATAAAVATPGNAKHRVLSPELSPLAPKATGTRRKRIRGHKRSESEMIGSRLPKEVENGAFLSKMQTANFAEDLKSLASNEEVPSPGLRRPPLNPNVRRAHFNGVETIPGPMVARKRTSSDPARGLIEEQDDEDAVETKNMTIHEDSPQMIMEQEPSLRIRSDMNIKSSGNLRGKTSLKRTKSTKMKRHSTASSSNASVHENPNESSYSIFDSVLGAAINAAGGGGARIRRSSGGNLADIAQGKSVTSSNASIASGSGRRRAYKISRKEKLRESHSLLEANLITKEQYDAFVREVLDELKSE